MAYTKDEVYQICQIDADDAFKLQQPRHAQWTTNYTLYRDTVQLNRLTQRQSVNIPLMKYVLKTAIKEVDDLVDIYFKSNSNDKQKEIFANAQWADMVTCENLAVQDITDKKQVFQYGRSTSGWNIVNGKIKFELDDSFDMYFGRFTNPVDVDGTCPYMTQKHIFRPLSDLENDPRYDAESLKKLKDFYSTQGGVIESGENTQAMVERQQRASDMGDTTAFTPVSGETVIEMEAHWIRLWNDEYSEPCIYYLESAKGIPLLFDTQENIIGKTTDNYWRNHFIKTTWADDVERNDMASDGLCDMIRPINQIVNAWFSQDVENRTLRNLNMHYYDSNIEGFVPQAFEPRPWGWYGIPLKQNQRMGDVMQTVDVQPLGDTLPAIQWAISIAEKAAATPPASSGQVAPTVTLGEVQLTLQEARDRVQAISKFYYPAWIERATKFLKLLEAAGDKIDAVKMFKKGYNGNMFGSKVSPSDWADSNGYSIEITTKKEVKAKALENLTVLNAVKGAMPLNAPLQKIYEQKMLDLIQGLTPEQIKQVTDFQEQLRARGILNQASAPGGAPTPASPGGGLPTAMPMTPSQKQMVPMVPTKQ